MNEACFYCDGTGNLQSKQTVAYDILRQIKRERQQAQIAARDRETDQARNCRHNQADMTVLPALPLAGGALDR